MRIFVKPAPGKTPRSPVAPYERIPVEGFVKEDGSHWRRLEAAGDIIISKEPKAAPAKKEA